MRGEGEEWVWFGWKREDAHCSEAPPRRSRCCSGRPARHWPDAVKIGVVEGLSGPPAIVDFGESYLQGIKLALEDYKAKGGKTPIELVVYDDEANPQARGIRGAAPDPERRRRGRHRHGLER